MAAMETVGRLLSTYWSYGSEYRQLEISEQSLYVLGIKYDGTKESDLIAVKEDFLSRLWVTYRRNFPPLEDKTTTSDRGWGCMLRCAQMMLAEATIRRQMGRKWRWTEETTDLNYLKIVNMFADNSLAPFSIHVMTALGAHLSVNIGQWISPSTVSKIVQGLPEFDVWNNFVVELVQDRTIFTEEIRANCRKFHPKQWNPLLLLIPMILGVGNIHPASLKGIQKFLEIPQCVGMLGGTPSHALYVIGYYGDDVLFLDPHTTQDAVVVDSKSTTEHMEADLTYHCPYTPHMPMSRLDTCIAWCFLCNTEEEFDDLLEQFKAEFSDTRTNHCLTILDKRPVYEKDNALCMMLDRSEVTSNFSTKTEDNKKKSDSGQQSVGLFDSITANAFRVTTTEEDSNEFRTSKGNEAEDAVFDLTAGQLAFYENSEDNGREDSSTTDESFELV